MNCFNSRTASIAHADPQLYLTGTSIGSITAAVTLIQNVHGWVQIFTSLRNKMENTLAGDRPCVVLEGTTKFAFIGQYVEIPNHCVFTTEYAIRRAVMTIQKLIDPSLDIPKIYRGEKNPSEVAATIRRFFAWL